MCILVYNYIVFSVSVVCWLLKYKNLRGGIIHYWIMPVDLFLSQWSSGSCVNTLSFWYLILKYSMTHLIVVRWSSLPKSRCPICSISGSREDQKLMKMGNLNHIYLSVSKLSTDILNTGNKAKSHQTMSVFASYRGCVSHIEVRLPWLSKT